MIRQVCLPHNLRSRRLPLPILVLEFHASTLSCTHRQQYCCRLVYCAFGSLILFKNLSNLVATSQNCTSTRTTNGRRDKGIVKGCTSTTNQLTSFVQGRHTTHVNVQIISQNQYDIRLYKDLTSSDREGHTHTTSR